METFFSLGGFQIQLLASLWVAFMKAGLIVLVIGILLGCGHFVIRRKGERNGA